MSKLDILNCAASGRVVFDYACPVGWDALEETDDPRKRWCPECSRPVFRCHDANEAGIRADQGDCIAVPSWLVAGLPDDSNPRRVGIGRPTPMAELFGRVVADKLKDNEQD